VKLSDVMRAGYAICSLGGLLSFKLFIQKPPLAVIRLSLHPFADDEVVDDSSYQRLMRQLMESGLNEPSAFDNDASFDQELELETKLSALQLPPLFWAIKCGDVDEVNAYLTNKILLENLRDFEGNTLLHYCLLVRPALFHSLLNDCKGLLVTQDNQGDNVLHIAIGQNNTPACAQILALDLAELFRKELIFAPNDLDLTPLALAASLGFKELVDLLLVQYSAYDNQFNDQIIAAIDFASLSVFQLEEYKQDDTDSVYIEGLRQIISTLEAYLAKYPAPGCVHLI
jgi:ankyrin repeat protein